DVQGGVSHLAGAEVKGLGKGLVLDAVRSVERDVAREAGKLGSASARQEFAKSVGHLLGASVQQLEAGFVRFGEGSIAEAFARKMGRIFEEHLTDAGSGLLAKEARQIGQNFGDAFVKHWGHLGADHAGLAEVLRGALGKLADNGPLSRMAREFPDLFTASAGKEGVGGFAGMFGHFTAEHPLHGNALFQLGHALGEILQEGGQNVASDIGYNLFWSEDHTFSTSWGSFVSGMAMGAFGHVLHKTFEPLFDRYQNWLRERQWRENPDGAKYFGLLHPLNFVSFLANMTGNPAPFPVPRPGGHDGDESWGQSAKDLAKWFFSNPFSGFDLRSDTPIVNLFTHKTGTGDAAREENPGQQAIDDALNGGNIKTTGAATDQAAGRGAAAPSDDGAPRPRTESGAPQHAPFHFGASQTSFSEEVLGALSTAAGHRTESSGPSHAPTTPTRDDAATDRAHRPASDVAAPQPSVDRPASDVAGPQPAVDRPQGEDTNAQHPVADPVAARVQSPPPPGPTDTGLSVDATAPELSSVVDRMRALGLIDDFTARRQRQALIRIAEGDRFDLAWADQVPGPAAKLIVSGFERTVNGPITPDMAKRIGFDLTSSVGKRGANLVEDVAKLRHFLTARGYDLTGRTTEDAASRLLADYLTNGTHEANVLDPSATIALRERLVTTADDRSAAGRAEPVVDPWAAAQRDGALVLPSGSVLSMDADARELVSVVDRLVVLGAIDGRTAGALRAPLLREGSSQWEWARRVPPGAAKAVAEHLGQVLRGPVSREMAARAGVVLESSVGPGGENRPGDVTRLHEFLADRGHAVPEDSEVHPATVLLAEYVKEGAEAPGLTVVDAAAILEREQEAADDRAAALDRTSEDDDADVTDGGVVGFPLSPAERRALRGDGELPEAAPVIDDASPSAAELLAEREALDGMFGGVDGPDDVLGADGAGVPEPDRSRPPLRDVRHRVEVAEVPAETPVDGESAVLDEAPSAERVTVGGASPSAADYSAVADALGVRDTDSGVLIADPRPGSVEANARAENALKHLPRRDDTFVVAMHVGAEGAPIGPEQLADVLVAAYDGGKLDGKSRIDFLSCRLGSPTESHVPEAMRALWAHQAANPRAGVAGTITGRAPVGDVWVVPKMADGRPVEAGAHEVIVADHVGVDRAGRPVVVQSSESFWRTFTDSGDGAHTVETAAEFGGLLTGDGTVVDHAPTGYDTLLATQREAKDVTGSVEGATKFGPDAGDGLQPFYQGVGRHGRDLHLDRGSAYYIESRLLASPGDQTGGRAYLSRTSFDDAEPNGADSSALLGFRGDLPTYRHLMADSSGQYTVQDLGDVPAPWAGGEKPFFVLVEVSGQRVRMTTSEGRSYGMAPGSFALLMAGDPVLQAKHRDAAIVLIVDQAGGLDLNLAREVARATGRVVFTPTAMVGRVEVPGGWAFALKAPATVQKSDGTWVPGWRGQIVRVDPPRLDGAVPRRGHSTVTTLDGQSISDADLLTRPIVDAVTLRPIGRTALPETDAYSSEGPMSRLREYSSYLVLSNANASLLVSRKVPWDPTHAYFFVGHANSEDFGLPSSAGELSVDGRELGRMLRRRPSVDRLVKKATEGVPASIVLVACDFAAQAQRVADEIGLPVHAPVGSAKLWKLRDPYDLANAAGLAVKETSDGFAGEFRTFLPGAGNSVSHGELAVEPVTIRFAGEGPDAGLKAAEALAKQLVPELRCRHRDGLHQPRLKVTGWGLGTTARADGQARAERVADVLRAALDDALAPHGLKLDLRSLVRSVSAGDSEPSGQVLPGQDPAVRRQTALIEMELPKPVALQAKAIPAGMWVGESTLHPIAAKAYSATLDKLPVRQNTFVVAMHVGQDGPPVSPAQLASVLLTAYTTGKLDGKALIEFVAHGLGADTQHHVRFALQRLWEYQSAHPREGAPWPLNGRAPTGSVWVVPTLDDSREVVLADHVGVAPDGKPVIVTGTDPKWRVFVDSGDGNHSIAEDDMPATVPLPTGYGAADEHVAAFLKPLEGAVNLTDTPPGLFVPGGGRHGRDLFALAGTDARVESRPLGGGPGKPVAGRAYLSEGSLPRHEHAGSRSAVERFIAHLPTYQHTITSAANPGTVVQRLDRVPVPWHGGPTPYVVMATVRDGSVRMAAEGGGDHTVSARAFAAMVAADPHLKALDPTVPLLLAASYAAESDLHLVRTLAAVTDRVVYAPTARIGVEREHSGWSFGLQAVDKLSGGKSAPRGQILRIDPPSKGGVDPALGRPGKVRTLDGRTVPDGELLMRPLAAPDLGIGGRSSTTSGDWATEEGQWHRVTAQSTYLLGPNASWDIYHRPVPWKGRTYFFTAHASTEEVKLVRTDGRPARVDGPEFGRFLSRRSSIAGLQELAAQGADASIVLVSCRSAAHAQAVADKTGLPVHAPTAITGTYSYDGDHYYPATPNVYVRRGDDRGYGEYLTFYPNERSPESLFNDEMTMPPRAVAFEQNTTDLSPKAERTVRNLARGIAPELIRRQLAGLEQPVFTLTGRGVGRLAAHASGRARAESVRDVLVEEVGARLSAANVAMDPGALDDLFKVGSAGQRTLPADLLPGRPEAERQRSVTVEAEFPVTMEEEPRARALEIPSGVWVTDRALPPRAQVQFRQVLDSLSARGDSFVVAMHVGERGAPVTGRQLADLLIEQYDEGMLDEKTGIDFLACRYGAANASEVQFALEELWRHQEQNPRMLVPADIPGRAPVGDVWVVPTANGEPDVIVAQQVGIGPDGKPVVVVGGESSWRTFSPDENGRAVVTDGVGGHLTEHGTVDGRLPVGYRHGDADEVTGPLDDAVKFGPQPASPAESSRAGGTAQPNGGAQTTPAQHGTVGPATDPAFAPAVPVDPAAVRTAPRRILETGRLSAADQVVGLRTDANELVKQITRLFGGGPDAAASRAVESLVRSYLDAQTLRPVLSALSRGDAWAMPIEGDGWSGTLGLSVKVVGMEFNRVVEKAEFEVGAEHQMGQGFAEDSRWRLTAGLTGKAKLPLVFSAGGSATYTRDSIHGSAAVEGARAIQRGKNIEPGAVFSATLRLTADHSALRYRGTPVRTGREARTALDIGAVVSVPVRDTLDAAGRRDPVGDRYAVPDRIKRDLRLGSSDVVSDVWVAQNLLRGLDDRGRSFFGSMWPDLRTKLETELSLTRLQQELRPMMSGQPIRVEYAHPDGLSKATVVVAASVASMWQTGNVKQTEFNLGSGTFRSRTRQAADGDSVQAPTPGQLEVANGAFTGNLGASKTVARDRVRLGGSSHEVSVASKTKAPAVEFVGIAALRLDFTTTNILETLTADATVDLHFRALIEQAEAVAVPSPVPSHEPATGPSDLRIVVTDENGAEVSAETLSMAAAGPDGDAHSTLTGPNGSAASTNRSQGSTADPTLFVRGDGAQAPDASFPVGAVVHTPADSVWLAGDQGGGLSDTTTVRDLRNVEPLRRQLDTLGHRALGKEWDAVRDDLHRTFAYDKVLADLTAMTRGRSLDSPVLTFGGRGRTVQVSATARITGMAFRRLQKAAELNTVNEVSTFTTKRYLLADGKAVQAQGGGTASVADSVLSAVGGSGGGGWQSRKRSGWRQGDSGKISASGKYARPEALFDATVEVALTISSGGREHRGTAEVEAEFGLDARETGSFTVAEGGATPNNGAFTGPVVAERATPAAPGELRLPPARIADGVMGASDVLHSLGTEDAKLLRAVENQLTAHLGELSPETRRVLRQAFDPVAVRTGLSQLTRSQQSVELSANGWHGKLTVRAVLKGFAHADTVATYEFDTGTQHRVTAGFGDDRVVTRNYTANLRAKLGQVDLGLGLTRGSDWAKGQTADTTGGTVSRGRNTEPAAFLSGTAEFTVDFALSKRGRPFPEQALVVPVTATVVVPLRETVRPRPLEAQHAERPEPGPGGAVPHRIEQFQRLGSSDVISNVYLLPDPDGGRPSIDATLRTVDAAARAALGSAWTGGLGKPGLRARVAEALQLDNLQPRLKAMMAGEPLVVADGRASVRITAAVGRLAHSGDIPQVEFNGGTTLQRTFAGSDGATAYGAGSGNTVTASVQVTTNAVAGVTVGAAVTKGSGRDVLEVQSQSVTSGMAVKTKMVGAALTGEVRLIFRMRRTPLIRLGDADRASPGAGVPRRYTAEAGVGSNGQTPLVDEATARVPSPLRRLLAFGTARHSMAVAKVGVEVTAESPDTKPTPAPDPTRTLDVRVPPARIFGDGLRDLDVVRWVGDVSGIRDLLHTHGSRFFSERTWKRLSEVAERTLSHPQLSSRAVAATQGQGLATPEPTNRWFVGEAGVTAALKIVSLEYRSTDAKAELSPANEFSVSSTRAAMGVRSLGGQAQSGGRVLGGTSLQGSLGLQHRGRAGLSEGNNGKIAAGGKLGLPMSRFDGHAQIELTFTKKELGRSRETETVSGLIPVSIDIPQSETTADTTPGDHRLVFDPAHPAGLAHPVVSPAPVQEFPAGDLLGHHRMDDATLRPFQQALQHLPVRPDTHVIAMHTGPDGVPLTRNQLAAALIDAYSQGRLDGKSTIEFVSCGLGADAVTHVEYAMTKLWQHHADPHFQRAEVSDTLIARAPLGAVWIAPKAVNGQVRPDGEHQVIVAEQLGLRPDGTPVVVVGEQSRWRTFADSGDQAHTPTVTDDLDVLPPPNGYQDAAQAQAAAEADAARLREAAASSRQHAAAAAEQRMRTYSASTDTEVIEIRRLSRALPAISADAARAGDSVASAVQIDQVSTDYRSDPDRAADRPPLSGAAFRNAYGRTAGGKTFQVVLEAYRAPGTGYFASDASLTQWKAAHDGGTPAEVTEKLAAPTTPDLPTTLPDLIYHQNISPGAAADTLTRVLAEAGGADSRELRPTDPAFQQVLRTDNGKAVANLVRQYNQLADLPDGAGYTIGGAAVLRDRNGNLHLRFDLEREHPQHPATDADGLAVLTPIDGAVKFGADTGTADYSLTGNQLDSVADLGLAPGRAGSETGAASLFDSLLRAGGDRLDLDGDGGPDAESLRNSLAEAFHEEALTRGSRSARIVPPTERSQFMAALRDGAWHPLLDQVVPDLMAGQFDLDVYLVQPDGTLLDARGNKVPPSSVDADTALVLAKVPGTRGERSRYAPVVPADDATRALDASEVRHWDGATDSGPEAPEPAPDADAPPSAAEAADRSVRSDDGSPTAEPASLGSHRSTAPQVGWSAAVVADRTLLGEEYQSVAEDTVVYVWLPMREFPDPDVAFAQGLAPAMTPTYTDATRGYIPLSEVLATPGSVEETPSMWLVGTTNDAYRPADTPYYSTDWVRFRVLAKEGVTVRAATEDGLGYGADTVAFFGGIRAELILGSEFDMAPRRAALWPLRSNPDYNPAVRPEGFAETTVGPMNELGEVQPSDGIVKLGSREVYERLADEIVEASEGRHPLPYDFVRPPGAPQLPAYFGLEVEFNHQDRTRHANVLLELADRLEEHGLSQPGVHGYHASHDHGYSADLATGRLEQDATVAGEYVSAKLDPERPETWQAVVDVMRLIREVGGYAGGAGAHIHFSLDYHDRPELMVPRLMTLVNLVKSFEDVLYQLGQDPHSPQHRGTEYAVPLDVAPSLGYTRRAHGLPQAGPSGRELRTYLRELSVRRQVAVNFRSVHGTDDDHLEVRLADANLDPRVTQALVELWGAIIVHAKNHPGQEFATAARPLGTAARQHRPEADVRQLPEGMRLTRHRYEDSDHFTRLVDLVFTDPAAKKRALALWLLTEPQRDRRRMMSAPPVTWEEGWLPTAHTVTMPELDWTVPMHPSAVADRPAVADGPAVRHTASGVLIADPRPGSEEANAQAEVALNHLLHRDDTFVVAMPAGGEDASVSPEQLAEVLVAAYDDGRLDGRSQIEFLSARLGASTERHLPEAMRALWEHQAAHPRPAAAGPFTGRAPLADVWIVPKLDGGQPDQGGGREVVVADHVGVDQAGRPVVARSTAPKWRTFTDSGDAQHTAVHHDTTDGAVPDGYRPGTGTDVLTSIDGAVTLGDPSPLPMPFSAGTGRQGRDLSLVPGTRVRVESRPLSEGPGSAVTGRAYLDVRSFGGYERVGRRSQLADFKADLPTYRHVLTSALDLDSDSDSDVGVSVDQVVGDLGRVPVPWRGGSAPYFVMAAVGPDGVRVAAERRGDHELTFDQFAELVAADPQLKALPPEVPVFLAAAHAARSDLELVRRIAAATNRVVYAPTGGIRIQDEPGGWSFALEAPATVEGGEPVPRGQIARIDPPSKGGVDPGPRRFGSVTTLDGGTVPDRMVLMHPIVEAGSLLVRGRGTLGDAEWAVDDLNVGQVIDNRSYVASTMSPVVLRRPVPWGEHTYFFVAHAGTESVALSTEDGGAIDVSGEELGGFLRRRVSVDALVRRAEQQGEKPSIALLACESAALAQEVADKTGLIVHAPTSETGMIYDEPTAQQGADRPEFVIEVHHETGAYGEFLTFHPNELSPESMGDGGMTMDPLAVVFAHRSTSLSPDEAEEVRAMGGQLVPELIRRHLAGLELPVVTVTGRGNGRFTAAWTGLKRAKVVRALLVDAIGAKLADANVKLDLSVRVESVGRGELPAEITPGGTPEERQRSAVISVEFPSAVAPVSSVVRSRDVPSGVWVTDRSLSASSQVVFREALDGLSARGDRFVVAMHVGSSGAPVSERQLADLLIAGYDGGKLDGKGGIDFLSCRFGGGDAGSVRFALEALWVHQAAHPRPLVPVGVEGRAPVGDVWVVPTAGGGREVVVAEQVGLRADGKPVVVVGGDSKWRRFTDSGDAQHTAVQEDVAGYRLTADGTIDGALPDGFESGAGADVVTPLEGAAKFGDPLPFSAGAGRQGRDLSVVPGTDVRVESRPLGEGPGSAVTGRAYLATQAFEAYELVGGPSELAGFKADLPTYRHVLVDATPPHQVVEDLGRIPVPWGGDRAPYFVMAELRADGVQLATEHGGDRRLSFGEFAELVAADPRLKAQHPDVPVFVAVASAARSDLELVRRIAAATDRVVYAPTNGIRRQEAWHGVWSFALEAPATVAGGKPGPRGQILRIDPPSKGAADPTLHRYGAVTTTDGMRVPDHMVLMRPVVDAGNLLVRGRASNHDADWSTHESNTALAIANRTYVTGVSRHPVALHRPVPWGEHTYFFLAHSDSLSVSLELESGRSVDASGPELGGFLTRRSSVTGLRKRAEELGEKPSIVLVACESAALAQAVADRTGLTVHAPTSRTGVIWQAATVHQPVVAPDLYVDAHSEAGPYGEYLTFHPNELMPEARGDAGMSVRPYVVSFDRWAVSPNPDGERSVRALGRQLAPELIRRHLVGLEQPVVTVTGRGNGRFLATSVGLKRAKSVRALLMNEIGTKLAAAKVKLDLGPLFRAESVGSDALPAGGPAGAHLRSAVISVEFPTGVAPVSTVVRSRDVPSGVWVTDRSLSASSQVQFREALD
ncbi:hypothetical protein, partial [Kitasatospora sp. NPDC002522]